MSSRPAPVLTSAYRVVLRLAIDDRPGMFANVARVIGEQGGSLGVIDLVEATPRVHVRDVTVDMPDEVTAGHLADALQGLDGIEVKSELAAAGALASVVTPDLRSAEYILPSPFDPQVVPAVAKAVAECARRSGVTR